eukprot:11209347-Lingulodinium_polyedra.AAC.1
MGWAPRVAPKTAGRKGGTTRGRARLPRRGSLRPTCRGQLGRATAEANPRLRRPLLRLTTPLGGPYPKTPNPL